MYSLDVWLKAKSQATGDLSEVQFVLPFCSVKASKTCPELNDFTVIKDFCLMHYSIKPAKKTLKFNILYFIESEMHTSPVEGVVQHMSANPQALPLVLPLTQQKTEGLDCESFVKDKQTTLLMA